MFVNEPDQIVEVTSEFRKNNKKISSGKFKLAIIYKREFELLLRLSGFKKWNVYGGFEGGPLMSHKQEMAWVIKK